MNTNDLIIEAINSKSVIECDYDGHHRVIEPHVYGIKKEKYQLRVYQIGGSSSSGTLGWKTMFVDKIINPHIMKQYFQGKRPTVTHPDWDKIIVIVDE